MNIYQLARLAGVRAREIIAECRPAMSGIEIGQVMWVYDHIRGETWAHGLPGWPRCECTACGCDEPATTTDDGGCCCCDECAEYAVDDDGEIHCSRCDDVEMIVESCGAGGQTRSYLRIAPPEMPEEDGRGEYALYWDTVGDDAHVVARFATAEAAKQAARAKDWPPPSDHAQYLCGYEVRELVAGAWVPAEVS